MKLFYNDVAIHTLGTVTLMEESSQLVPSESPQREEVTLSFRIDVWLRSYADNRETLKLVQAALKVQHAKLKVVQERIPGTTTDSDLVIIDQTARLTSQNFPSDINEWGTTRQQLRLTFVLAKHDLNANAVQAIVTPTAQGATDFNLGNVYGWKDSYQTQFYDKMRDIREYVGGTINARGEFLGNMSMSLADRRAALITLKEQWVNALNHKSGRLRFGDFDKIVRFDNFEAEVDQHIEKIAWSFSAHYTKFPNENGYAGADYEIATKKNSEDGDIILSFSGKIVAESQERAEAKLANIRSAVLAANAFTIGRQTKNEIKAHKVSSSSFDGSTDVGDGEAFIELTFSDEYRKRDPDHLSWTLSVDSKEETNSGLITVTYSGTVTAGYTGGTGNNEPDKAYFNAAAKARELGENKHAFRLSGSIKRDDRQTTKTAGREFVKVEFSFTYQFRGNRVFMEVRAETERNTFGDDIESVSGFVVGGDDAAVAAAYATIRDVYNNRIVRNDRNSTTEHRLAKGVMAGDPTAPNTLFGFTPQVGYEALPVRFDFSFQVFKPKPDGAYAIKYGIKISKSFRNNTCTVVVDGTLFGTAAIIDDSLNEIPGNKLDALLASLNYGRVLDRERSADREYIPSVQNIGNGLSMALKFTESFEAQLTGDDQIIECEVDEEIQFSGDRNVVIPIMDRSPEIQKVGTTEARRTVSGHVVASNETAALKWVKKQKAIPYPTANPQTGFGVAPAAADRFLEPPKISINNNFSPFVEGEIRGTDAAKGPKMVKVTFSFSEIIRDYSYFV